MEAVFKAPKRRARVYEAYEAPLPIPRTEEEANQLGERIYRAEMVNQHVLVRDPKHIKELYGKGYFGKGLLSRARPEHSISRYWEGCGDRQLPVISRSKYEQQLNWARGALVAQGLDEDTISQTLLRLCQPVELEDQRMWEGQEKNGYNEEKEEEEETNGSVRKDGGQYRHCTQRLQCGSDSQPETLTDLHPEKGGLSRDCAQRKRHQSGSDSEPEAPAEPQTNKGGEDGETPQAKRPRRQGDLRFDPLAELYPEEPQQVDQRARCPRHDDWIAHCGCHWHPDPEPDPRLLEPGYDYVLVTDDTQEDGQVVEGGSREVRVNPFRLIEYLQLSLEEAFFLVYALGCLSVYHNEEPLTIIQLWQIFRSVQPNFDCSYAAYHHYRSKGWVPKPGLKYGSDFMIYRRGPPFYHASYSVVVEKVGETFRSAASRRFSWRSLAALSRITGSVSKELMFCYIIYPANLSETELSSPLCLSRLTAQEVIVSRWVSSKERADQDDI